MTSSAGTARVLTVLTVAVGLQCLRVVFPVAYTYREANGIPLTVIAVLVVFLAPAAAPLLAHATRPRVAIACTTAALVAVRILVQAVDQVGIVVAVLTAAVGLAAVALVVQPDGDGRAPTLGLLGGLALDTAVRAAWGTWDLSWQHDAGAVIGTAVLLAALVGVAVLAAREPANGTRAARDDRTWTGLALGPFLALQILFLQSVAAVAAAGALALATATAVVLAGDGLAALAVVRVTTRPLPRAAIAVCTVAAALAAFALPRATGAGIVVLVLVGQVLASILFARAAAAPAQTANWTRGVAGTAAGGVVLGLTLFLYQLHYDTPLPVSNRWLLVGAAVVLGIAAFGTAPVVVERRAHGRRGVVALAAAIVVAELAVVTGIALGEPDLAPSARAPAQLRVVTFNIHDAVTRDGRIDPETVARAVERLRPDVLVIEEAGRGWLLSSTFDVGEWLKRRLDLPYRWAPAADEQMGNLVFSRVRIAEARVVELPRGTGTMDRSALIARVGPVGGRAVTLIGVHFQNGSTPDRLQTRIVETDVLFSQWKHAPRTVIAGDFNMDPGERDLRHLLAGGLTSTQPTDECTLPTSNQNCSDWIVVTDDVVQGPARVLSVPRFDHNPVLTTVRPR